MGIMLISEGKPWKRGIDREIMTAYLEGKKIDEIALQVRQTPGQVASIEREAREVFGSHHAEGSVRPALFKGYLTCDFNENWDNQDPPTLGEEQLDLIRHLGQDKSRKDFALERKYTPPEMTAFVKLLYRDTGCKNGVELVRFAIEHALLWD
jgi:hypothetical protein